MELEELSNLSKNDFLPLIPSIKQEQLDTALSDMDTQEHLTASTSAAAASTSSSSSSIVNHPCDSAEKRSESTSTSISSNISKPIATKCVFCAQTLGINDRPKLLECLHVTCSQCMSTKFAELDRTMPPLIHCPICNMASQNEFIIDNQFLIEHCTGAGDMSADANDSIGSKTSNNIPCSSCSDNNIATSWCVDCSEYICDSCVQAHQRLKITKDHTIKPKEEANNEQLPSSAVDKLHMCVLHPQEKLSLYCETCEKLTCRDCQLSDHRDHKYKFAHEIATETRHAITSMVAEINYKRFLLTSAMQVIAERQKVISDKKKELIKEITAMVVTITNTVNMRGKQLVMRLNEVCDGKLKLLVDKRDSLISLSDNTDYCIDFIANVLDKGSDYAILSSKKSLVRHLQKLKCQRADIPNPDIPLRIDLQMCQIQQLQKVHNTKTTEKDDPNEDWCAVCLDGGELMCCDKCPKVFHQNCHIPAISSLPDESESWQCLLCVNLKELASNPDNLQKNPGELSRLELQILQRICLELFCQYEQSLHFREPEPPSNTAYYEIVCNPMSLDVIRTRLDPSSQNHYKDISSFIADVRLIFKNTYLFYQEDSKTYTNAKYLENFFEEQLAKWLPSYANKSINANNANSILNSGPGSALSNGNNNGNNSNSASTSASPAPGAPSPSLENGGRKSSNSAMLNMNTNSNGSSASTHRSDDNNIDDGFDIYMINTTTTTTSKIFELITKELKKYKIYKKKQERQSLTLILEEKKQTTIWKIY
ncbi:hypothetical protein FF38_10786 [Lucilia cuprina]|uniref:E3 ubiquitin-protein ligase TRIM33 n=1 Tax=Lucilia cuprina TaxID=7375 RepID=A0A0L0C447_LUCCU|nr:hypothetical protein FF38_10786 [Lucilia cuprina]